jgi:hypothetical protein
MLAVALDDDGAEPVCAAERVERRQQPLDQLAVVGVVDLRAVERDGRDAAASTLHSTGPVVFDGFMESL